jgi:group I intron endonuclease
MNNNNNNGNIIPIITYTNLESNKYIIYKENKNKSGISRWDNLVTGLSCVGSAVNLNKRLTNYFSRGFLKKEVIRNNSIISNSLLKHDYINFSLDILEYCESHNLITREQYYLDLLKPGYNILPIAGSRLGAKHSPETLLKFKTRKLSPKALANLKLAKAG